MQTYTRIISNSKCYPLLSLETSKLSKPGPLRGGPLRHPPKLSYKNFVRQKKFTARKTTPARRATSTPRPHFEK